MLGRLIRVAIFVALVGLVWHGLLKPETRQRIHGRVQILAYIMLVSSVLMAAWHWWEYGLG